MILEIRNSGHYSSARCRMLNFYSVFFEGSQVSRQFKRPSDAYLDAVRFAELLPDKECKIVIK